MSPVCNDFLRFLEANLGHLQYMLTSSGLSSKDPIMKLGRLHIAFLFNGAESVAFRPLCSLFDSINFPSFVLKRSPFGRSRVSISAYHEDVEFLKGIEDQFIKNSQRLPNPQKAIVEANHPIRAVTTRFLPPLNTAPLPKSISDRFSNYDYAFEATKAQILVDHGKPPATERHRQVCDCGAAKIGYTTEVGHSYWCSMVSKK